MSDMQASGQTGSVPAAFGGGVGFGSSEEDLPWGFSNGNLGCSSSLRRDNQDSESIADPSAASSSELMRM